MTSPRDTRFKGLATPLASGDIAAAAARLDVEEAKLRAVIEVEAPGDTGYDRAGRPKILYEAHVFWRNLPRELREEANRQGLAWSQWERNRYPRGEDAMYATLERACDIDEEAALKACSWGLPQILGENHLMVGYPTVQQMVLDVMAGERQQIDMFVAYIEAANLVVPLRMGDWAGFAQGYNGPSFEMHDYDGRLQAAYERLVVKAAPQIDVIVVKPPAAPPVPATSTGRRRTEPAQPAAGEFEHVADASSAG